MFHASFTSPAILSDLYKEFVRGRYERLLTGAKLEEKGMFATLVNIYVLFSSSSSFETTCKYSLDLTRNKKSENESNMI